MTGETSAAPLTEQTNGAGDAARRIAGTMWAPRPVADQPPVRWREVAAVVVTVVLSDLTIYRGHGFAGYAVLFCLLPLLFAFGAFHPRMGAAAWIVGVMLALMAAKTIWCGSVLLVAAGFSLLASFVMALSGQTPFVAETAVFASQSIGSGYRRLIHYGRSTTTPSWMRVPALNIGLPLLALVVFGTVFVLANPDLVSSFSEALEQLSKRVREWLLRMSVGEISFWVAAAWILFALTPVDAIVMEYNVRRILAGDPAASVQISVQPIGSEGVLLLEPLLECDDPIIREGVGAMLAQRDDDAEALARRRESLGWTSYQISDAVVLERLRTGRPKWSAYRDGKLRQAALQKFHEYAYQWY